MLRTYVAYSVQKLRALRKPVASHRALDRRKKMLVLGIALMFGVAGALALLLVGCGGGNSGVILPPPPTPAFQPLTQAEVTQIVAAAAAAASADTMVIAVVDRQGKVLGVFRKPNASGLAMSNFSTMEDANDVAVALARTGAFFSNNQAPLTSRTVRFISGIHLPPGVMNQPPADLYGIENTNRGCMLSAELEGNGFKPAKPVSGAKALGIMTGKKDTIDHTSPPAGAGSGTATGGTWFVAASDGTGTPAEGDLVTPAAGSGGLSAADVTTILGNAEAQANLTRAAIRLPEGSRARMVIAVADLDGRIIGLRRMPDSTVFSIDVAATKARNMVYFNGSTRLAADLNQVPAGTAVTNRTISFGAMPLFPPGIDGTSPGPFFNLYAADTANPCTQGFQSGAADDKKSGIVFFPGSAGLYRNGVLVGGLGVSGDGVDQDDFVTSAGTKGFEAPAAIRADQISISSVRLPYFKFPRNPTD